MAIQPQHVSEETPLILPANADVSPEAIAEDREQVLDHDGPNQSVGATRATLIILSLWVLIFLQASNMSGLTTTQSAIAGDLHVFEGASWFTSTYLIAMSSIAPLAGKLSQIFPPRNLVFFSAFLFGIGGLVTSQARSFSVFLVGRAISGVGGAGILTISIILVLELTSKKKRGLFIGLVNAGYTSGVALGAVIAGALLSTTGWRPMFWIQTPLALLAGGGVYLSIPSSFSAGNHGGKDDTLYQKLSKIDYAGAITLTSTIILFLYGLSSAKIQWLPVAISATLLPLFVVNEIYSAQNPIIPITVLSSRGALLTCFAQLAFMASRWTVLFYTPVYAIAVKGWSPAVAGSILVPTNAGFAIGGLLVGWLHIKRAGSFYIPSLLSFLLFATTLLTIAYTTTSTTPPKAFILLVFANGLTTGASLNYTLAQILHLSPPSTHFIVTSLLATFRGFAGSFGSAIGGGIFSRSLRSNLEHGFGLIGDAAIFVTTTSTTTTSSTPEDRETLIRKLISSPALVSQLTGEEKIVAIRSYEAAFRILFLAATACAVFALVVQALAGWKAGVDDDGVGGVMKRGGSREVDEDEEGQE